MGMAYSHALARSKCVPIPRPHSRTPCGRTTGDQAHAICLCAGKSDPRRPLLHRKHAPLDVIPADSPCDACLNSGPLQSSVRCLVIYLYVISITLLQSLQHAIR